MLHYLGEDGWSDSIADSSSFLSSKASENLNAVSSSPSLRSKLSKSLVEDEPPLPLLKSLFQNKPPTLYFTVDGEEGKQCGLEAKMDGLMVHWWFEL